MVADGPFSNSALGPGRRWYPASVPGWIGFPELIVLLIVLLLIFGPKRLPELGRSMGKGIREFRGSISGKDDDEDDDDDEKSSKPAAIEGAQDADEPVEGEVVTNQRS